MGLNKRIDKDGLTKKYLGKNDVFADLFNYYLYDGKQVIDKNNLVDVDTNLIVNNPNDIKRVRDLYKKVEIKKDNNLTYLLLGIENQTSNLNGMVLRTLLYDVMSYDKQVLDIVNSKNNGKIKSERGYHYKDLSLNDKLSPVITLVVYFNHKKWSGHKRFIDMVNVSSPAMKEYIIDYKLNIIEPNFMTDDDFNKFKTEIGLVLESVKYSNNKNMFLTTIQNKMNYKNMNIDTADFIKSVVNLDIKYEEKDGKINMCKALEDLKKDWKAEGKTEGINQSIQALHSNGIEENAIAKLLCLDIQYVREVLAK